MAVAVRRQVGAQELGPDPGFTGRREPPRPLRLEIGPMTATSTPDVSLQISGLWKTFGDFVALKDISLEVMDGEFVCFLGPSGCGKTTLLRAIAGLDLQTRGTVIQDGRDVSALPPSQRDFGIVFQSYALFPNLTVYRNVAYGLENQGHARAEIRARVTELLETVGLPDQSDKYPAQLSGGQQQRVALARAIATSPGLLLLDEPLSALDAKVRVRLRHEIKDLQRRLGVTTIMVTHDQEEALSMADRIVVMNHGVIEQIGTPTTVYRDPASLFVAGFIGEMNQFDARVVDSATVRVGQSEFCCRTHDHEAGAAVVAAIRPDEIVPLGTGYRPSPDDVNCERVTLADMAFLGSFWRCLLHSEDFGREALMADFPTNAVRRLSLEAGQDIHVSLQESGLMAFARDV